MCKDICDPQGGAPMCGANHACVVYGGLFYDGTTAVAAVCDPLADNDFDGPGSALSRTGSANVGCHGVGGGELQLRGRHQLHDRAPPPARRAPRACVRHITA